MLLYWHLWTQLARKIHCTPCWALERPYRGFIDLDAFLLWYLAGKEGWPGMVKDNVLFRAQSKYIGFLYPSDYGVSALIILLLILDTLQVHNFSYCFFKNYEN